MTRLNRDDILQSLTINKDIKKCFIFDLDGTIIFNNQSLSLELEELFKKIKDYNHEIMFATGRMPNDFKKLIPHWLQETAIATLCNGRLIYKGNDILSGKHILNNIVKHIVDICIKNKINFILDSVNESYYSNNKIYEEYSLYDTNHYKLFNLDNSSFFNTVKIYRISILYNNSNYRYYKELFSQICDKSGLYLQTYDYIYNNNYGFDLLVKDANKYFALAPFIKTYNNKDVYIFGNDYNDCVLFENIHNSIYIGANNIIRQKAKLGIHYDNNYHNNVINIINTIIE